MSTRVDFAFGAANRFDKAAQTLQALYNKQQQAVVYCQDQKRILTLSKKLWSIEASAFIAHDIVDSIEDLPPSPASIVIISNGLEDLPQAYRDRWLLNMDLQCPPGYLLFKRLLEVVSNHEQDVAHARLRWQQYRNDGAELHSKKTFLNKFNLFVF